MAPSRGGTRQRKKAPNPLKAAAQAAALAARGGGEGGAGDDVHAGGGEPLDVEVRHCPPLLTLVFHSRAHQHAALARLEAFYESSDRSDAYLDLEAARASRLCPNYDAFNLPLLAVREWLKAMRGWHADQDARRVQVLEEQPATTSALEAALEAAPTPPDPTLADVTAWWEPHCNPQERQLLAILVRLGLVDTSPSVTTPIEAEIRQHSDVPPPTNGAEVPTQAACELVPTSQSEYPSSQHNTTRYLISVLASQLDAGLAHERLHALYHLSPSYRLAVEASYRSLARATRKRVEADLAHRGYRREVWQDEFQAYASLDPGEFGNACRTECQDAADALRQAQARAWSEAGLEPHRSPP